MLARKRSRDQQKRRNSSLRKKAAKVQKRKLDVVRLLSNFFCLDLLRHMLRLAKPYSSYEFKTTYYYINIKMNLDPRGSILWEDGRLKIKHCNEELMASSFNKDIWKVITMRYWCHEIQNLWIFFLSGCPTFLLFVNVCLCNSFLIKKPPINKRQH